MITFYKGSLIRRERDGLMHEYDLVSVNGHVEVYLPLEHYMEGEQ